jgi:hypothetical protein
MQLIVRAFPIAAGNEGSMWEFVEEVRNARAGEVADFYRRMGVGRECWYLQNTPHGVWIIAVTQLPEKPVELAAQDYSTSQHPFDRWFKDQVKRITGVDPETTPLGPPTQCIFDTQALPEHGQS